MLENKRVRRWKKFAVFAGLNPKIDALDFEKDFYPAVMDCAFQVQFVDCNGHDHRSAGAQIPIQCSRDKSESELDAANASARLRS